MCAHASLIVPCGGIFLVVSVQEMSQSSSSRAVVSHSRVRVTYGFHVGQSIMGDLVFSMSEVSLVCCGVWMCGRVPGCLAPTLDHGGFKIINELRELSVFPVVEKVVENSVCELPVAM